MNTKEKILVEALKLFAKKGYSDVYVKEIAAHVGIKAPSLYKHYKNKQEIFDNCITIFYEKMNKKRAMLLLPKDSSGSKVYVNKTRLDIINIAQGLFDFYLRDEVASNFRKMLLIDRYKDSKINDIYEKIFIIEPIVYQTEVFSHLMKLDKMKRDVPENIANMFYSQIYFILQKYDCRLDKLELGKKEVETFINHFCDIWELGR